MARKKPLNFKSMTVVGGIQISVRSVLKNKKYILLLHDNAQPHVARKLKKNFRANWVLNH